MEILNHLEDLSNCGWIWTEEDKKILVDFQNNLINAGYTIKYLNAPVDITEDGLMTAVSRRFSRVSSGDELFKELANDFVTENKYNHIFNNNNIYIYKMAKLKFMDAETLYAIRIGTDYKFN